MPELQVTREVDPSAQVAPSAKLGNRTVVGAGVTIGPGTVLEANVTVIGNTAIGSDNVIGEGTVLGAAPQDLKYSGSDTLLLVGHRNRFGHRVTAHIGTEVGGYLTRIGNDNVFGDDSHVAHDCYVDDRTVIGARALLAGHIRVETGAVIDEDCGVHHFVTVGRYAHIGKQTPARRDVPPFTLFATDDPERSPSVKGVHEAGLAAADLSDDERSDLRRALLELFEDEGALQTKLEQFVTLGVEGEIRQLCEFCQRSLQGRYGRCREQFRGMLPPEAGSFLTPEQLAEARRWVA